MRRQNNLIVTMFAFIFALLAVKIVESVPVKSAEIIASSGMQVTIACDIGYLQTQSSI